MSSRVAFKAALLTLALMLVLFGVSAHSLSVDRNGELTESLAFGCAVAVDLMEEVNGDEARVAILENLPSGLQIGMTYIAPDGTSVYANSDAREPDEELLLQRGQATEELVRYQGYDQSGERTLYVLYTFSDGASLCMSCPGVSALGMLSERLFLYVLLGVGSSGIVFALTYIHDARRRSVSRQIVDVLRDFGEGHYDARVQPQRNEMREEVEEVNGALEQIKQRVFKQRSRDHALSVVMNQMQSGIIVVDARLHILLVTPMARKLLGVAPNSEGVAITEASKDVNLDSVFSEAMRREGIYTNEVAARTAVGRGHRPLRLYVSPMRQDGKVIGALAMVEDISKLESGMTEGASVLIRLDKLAFEVADMLRIHAEEKQVTINAHRNKTPVYIVGDPDRVEQMLINLIENGIKYNKPGGSVTVHVFGNEREANLTISDTGIGIAEEHLPRLFERFYRVDKGRSRSMGGTGLGLAIVKHIVRSMNGEIEVHSKLGEGTEFLVTLPVAQGPDDAPSADEIVDVDEARAREIAESAPGAESAPRQDAEVEQTV